MSLVKPSVAVLYGGISSERSISLESGANVARALRETGYPVSLVDVDARFITDPPVIAQDVVFIALHGRYGEDGDLQKLLESRGIPFTGSGSVSSAISMDKTTSREHFEKAGLLVARGVVFNADRGFDVREVASNMYPVIVKPACEGSTIGISVAHGPDELIRCCEEAARYGSKVLVEQFIHGREFTIALLGETPLSAIEIRPSHEIFDFDSKYSDPATRYLFDHGLSAAEEGSLQSDALAAYRSVGSAGIARVDFIRTAEGRNYVLEINTVPGMTSHSLVPMAAKRAGISFERLCEIALEMARSKSGKEWRA